MGQTYSQLTEGERNQFYALRQARMPMKEIANQLGRSRTTLYNELVGHLQGDTFNIYAYSRQNLLCGNTFALHDFPFK